MMRSVIVIINKRIYDDDDDDDANNNNSRISIAPYRDNFRDAVGRLDRVQ